MTSLPLLRSFQKLFFPARFNQTLGSPFNSLSLSLCLPSRSSNFVRSCSSSSSSSLMAAMECRGCVYRIKNCAFDLLSMEDELMDDDDEYAWELMGSDLRLKSTFLYCDLNKVISHAGVEHRQTLVDLSNKLLCYMEELGHAVEARSIALTQDRYNDTAHVLREVVAALASSPHL